MGEWNIKITLQDAQNDKWVFTLIFLLIFRFVYFSLRPLVSLLHFFRIPRSTAKNCNPAQMHTMHLFIQINNFSAGNLRDNDTQRKGEGERWEVLTSHLECSILHWRKINQTEPVYHSHHNICIELTQFVAKIITHLHHKWDQMTFRLNLHRRLE